MEATEIKPMQAIIPQSVRAKAPRPAEMMITVDIETDCANLVIDGWTIPPGTSRITVPVAYLERVKSLVETRTARIAQAQANFEYLVAEAGKPAEDLPYSVQAEFTKLANPNEKQRDMLPLKSCVEVGDPFMRPADGAEQQEANALGMASAIAKAIRNEREDVDKLIEAAVTRALAAERSARKG